MDWPATAVVESDRRRRDVAMKTIKRAAGTMTPTKKAKTSHKEEKESFALATARSTPVADLGGYVILIYGEKKIGKTTLTSRFKDTYHMMFEPGGKALSIFQDAYSSWARVKRAVGLLETDKRFGTVTWDPVDVAFKLCERWVSREMGIEHPSDAEWGKGWSRLRDEFTLTLNRLTGSGKGVVLISHDTVKEIKRRNGDTYNVITSTMPGMARDIVEGMVDIWAYYGYDGERRVLHIRGDDTLSAGHRLKNHFTWKGTPVRIIDMGNSEEEAYERFMACFNNQYNPADYEPAKRPVEDDEPPSRLSKAPKKLKRR